MNKRIFVAMAGCIFFAFFYWPAYYIDGPDKVVHPIAIFLFGWLGLLAGSFACMAWLANPLFFLAIFLFLRNRKLAILISLMAVLFAGSFLLFHTIIDNEAGGYATIMEYKAGYWLWLGSMGMQLVTVLLFSAKGAP